MSAPDPRTQLVPFDNGEFHLDVEPEGDSFKVRAPGLAKALGFREAFDLLRNIPDEEKGSELVRTPGGDQQIGYVTEAGFYRALGQRQAARITGDFARAQVVRFQNWVYREVLPAIRRTGSYVGQVTPRELAAMVIAEADRADAAEAKARELAPAAQSWQTLAEASGDYSMREAAQILNRDPSIQTGQNRLSRHLREIGWVDEAGTPYQRHVDAGRLILRMYTDRQDVLRRQIRVTAKGLQALHAGMGGSGALLLEVAS